MRIVFCNIAWMKYYRGILGNGEDKPISGGSYARNSKETHEKYNFYSVQLKKGNLVDKAGGYCLGYMEAKTSGNAKNHLYLERIPGCELMEGETVAEDVLVVFCATHPDHKFTTVVGWYQHAKVFREYQSMVLKSPVDGEEYLQTFNVLAKKEDCVLLPMKERSRKAIWGVPRQQSGASYGFSRANVWYPQNKDDNSNLTTYLERLAKQIKSYEEENWMDKVIE